MHAVRSTACMHTLMHKNALFLVPIDLSSVATIHTGCLVRAAFTLHILAAATMCS